MRGNQIPRTQSGDGAQGRGQPWPRSLPGPSPSANLAGKWKGDPLSPQVAALTVSPIKMRCRIVRQPGGRLLLSAHGANKRAARNHIRRCVMLAFTSYTFGSVAEFAFLAVIVLVAFLLTLGP